MWITTTTTSITTTTTTSSPLQLTFTLSTLGPAGPSGRKAGVGVSERSMLVTWVSTTTTTTTTTSSPPQPTFTLSNLDPAGPKRSEGRCTTTTTTPTHTTTTTTTTITTTTTTTTTSSQHQLTFILSTLDPAGPSGRKAAVGVSEKSMPTMWVSTRPWPSSSMDSPGLSSLSGSSGNTL